MTAIRPWHIHKSDLFIMDLLPVSFWQTFFCELLVASYQ